MKYRQVVKMVQKDVGTMSDRKGATEPLNTIEKRV